MKRSLALLVCVALLTPRAYAGTIQLKADSVFDPFASPPSVMIRLSNEGSEAARQVRVETDIGGAVSRAAPIPRLDSGDTTILKIPVKGLPSAHGFYVAVVRMRYADAGGYPYSAVSVVDVSIGDVMPADWIVGKLESAAISGRGSVKLRIDPVEDRDMSVSVRLALPDELTGGAGATRVSVKPGTSCTVALPVENGGARPGSRYLAFAIMDYVVNGTNQSAVAGALISVSESPDAAPLRYGLWFAAGLLVLLALLLARRKGGDRPQDRA